MAFAHPKLDLISAPLASFDFSAPFLGEGRWTTADGGGAGGGELEPARDRLKSHEIVALNLPFPACIRGESAQTAVAWTLAHVCWLPAQFLI